MKALSNAGYRTALANSNVLRPMPKARRRRRQIWRAATAGRALEGRVRQVRAVRPRDDLAAAQPGTSGLEPDPALSRRHRTYPTTVEDEVNAALARPENFLHGPIAITRDTPENPNDFAVVDGNYVSARWPGDAHRSRARLPDCMYTPVRALRLLSSCTRTTRSPCLNIGAAVHTSPRKKRWHPHVPPCSSARLQVDRGQLSLLAPLDVEAHLLALIEGADPGALDSRDVHKHILRPVARLDEAVPFLGVEPLDRTCRHQSLPVTPAKSRAHAGHHRLFFRGNRCNAHSVQERNSAPAEKLSRLSGRPR